MVNDSGIDSGVAVDKSRLRSKPLNGQLRPVNNSYDVKPHQVSGAGSAIMEESATKLTELQFAILNRMADDYEDVEQLYLNANREFAEEKLESVQLPRALVQVRFPLRDIVDEITNRVREVATQPCPLCHTKQSLARHSTCTVHGRSLRAILRPQDIVAQIGAPALTKSKDNWPFLNWHHVPDFCCYLQI
jgi:hypothetical protein